jgi:hypothetical protein
MATLTSFSDYFNNLLAIQVLMATLTSQYFLSTMIYSALGHCQSVLAKLGLAVSEQAWPIRIGSVRVQNISWDSAIFCLLYYLIHVTLFHLKVILRSLIWWDKS